VFRWPDSQGSALPDPLLSLNGKSPVEKPVV
jgi:hypothetical protein